MSDSNLFRKAALDKLASPERLDVLMHVAAPRDAVAKWTVAALISAAVLWGIFGRIPERIPGDGQLQGGGGTQQIVAAGEGLLSTITVAENDNVKEGQQIGTIAGVGLQQSTQAEEARYQEAERQLTLTRSLESGHIADLETKRQNFVGLMQAQELQLARKEPLVKSGDLPAKDLLQIRNTIEGLKSSITDIDIQINRRQAAIKSAESMVRQAKIDLDQATNTVAEVTQVRAPTTGRVTRVYKQQGDPVSRGDVLVDVEVASADGAMEIVAFVPATYGQRVEAGDAVQVTVAGIRREDAGFLKGLVTFVSPALVSAERVAAVTKEGKTQGASYELRIAPVVDPSTISGYAWSTGKGPPQKFSGAVPVTIAVEVGDRTPFRQFLGFVMGLFGT
jgi:HlyD family secretion protein